MGISPEYFLYKMSWMEVNICIAQGYQKERERWEQTRMISYIIAQCNSAKELDIKDLITFGWDEKEVADITADDIAELRKKAKEAENQLNKKDDRCNC